jgi:hypothetical protein
MPPIDHDSLRLSGIADGIGSRLTGVDRGGTIRDRRTADLPPALSFGVQEDTF